VRGVSRKEYPAVRPAGRQPGVEPVDDLACDGTVWVRLVRPQKVLNHCGDQKVLIAFMWMQLKLKTARAVRAGQGDAGPLRVAEHLGMRRWIL